ncbi:hypothetical protein LPJ70_000551 [Coemansia sp. RSA 2708]|nr:hypothetical protein LPJ70_000551 [Coemansia sp. RSA 2708]
MASTASSAIPLPASEPTPQAGDKPALTFSPSTRFPAEQAESDEGSDPDDLAGPQLDAVRERVGRDQARDAIRKEQAWNKRWCVLRSQALLIYKHSSEEKLKRIVRADEIVDVRHVSRRNHSFVFEVETPERSFFFEASSEQELVTWTARMRAVVAAVNASSDASNRRSSDAFLSLPAPRRAADTHAQAIFAVSDGPDDAGAERPPRPVRMASTLGLRIEPGRPANAPLDAAGALPPGIDRGHEPQPIDGDDDDEPNFSEAQRLEIERRLDADRVVLRGYLLKQDKLRQWRRRWFVLRQNTLAYYHDDREYEVKQILRHHDIYDVRAPDPSTAKAKSLHRTYFKLVAAKRNYWLAHDDAAVAREWFAALRLWCESAAYPSLAAVAKSAPARTGLPAAPIHAPRVYSPATSPAHADPPPPIGRHASSNALKPSR